MEKLFIYGTLKDATIQQELLGRVCKMTNDILENYKLSTIEIENELYPLIIPTSHNFVEGKIIEINKSELALLDEYETHSYKRIKCVLRSSASAWVYVSNN